MRYRGKGMQTSLVKEGEHHGLHNIILVMGIGNLIAAQILYGVIQSAFTRILAQREQGLFSLRSSNTILAIEVSTTV